MKDRSYIIKTLLTAVYALIVFWFLRSLTDLGSRGAPSHYVFLGALLIFSIVVVGIVIIYRGKIISNHVLKLLFYWIFGLVLTFFFNEILGYIRNLYLYDLWNISESEISDASNKFEYAMKDIGAASLGVFKHFKRGLGVDLSVHVSCVLSIFAGLFIEFTWRKRVSSERKVTKALDYLFLGIVFLAINLLAISLMMHSQESIFIKLFFTVLNLFITGFCSLLTFQCVRRWDRFIAFYAYFVVGVLGAVILVAIWSLFVDMGDGLELVYQGFLQTLIWGYFFENYFPKRTEEIEETI